MHESMWVLWVWMRELTLWGHKSLYAVSLWRASLHMGTKIEVSISINHDIWGLILGLSKLKQVVIMVIVRLRLCKMNVGLCSAPESDGDTPAPNATQVICATGSHTKLLIRCDQTPFLHCDWSFQAAQKTPLRWCDSSDDLKNCWKYQTQAKFACDAVSPKSIVVDVHTGIMIFKPLMSWYWT